jgi:hypothetical protein
VILGRRRGANQRTCRHARASHADAAAHRAVITAAADHPARGDARVVRTTARCSNVAGADAAVRQQVRTFRTERGEETAMLVIWWILFAVIWIAIAFWPARVAGRKGHSFIGYFIFSLFFFFAAIIVAYLIPDRTRIPGRESTAVS